VISDVDGSSFRRISLRQPLRSSREERLVARHRSVSSHFDRIRRRQTPLSVRDTCFAMRISHRGLEIELSGSDPRVAEVERLLFGTILPTLVAEAAPPPPPKPLAETVPPPFLKLWLLLDPVGRRELALLAERPHTVFELEELLGLHAGAVLGLHGVLGRYARRVGLELPVQRTGRLRRSRSFSIPDDVAAWVRAIVAAPAEWSLLDRPVLPRLRRRRRR